MVLMLAVSLLINMVLIFLYTSLKRDLKALRSQIQYANENNSRFPFFTGSVNHDLKKIICLLNITFIYKPQRILYSLFNIYSICRSYIFRNGFGYS